MSADLEAAVRRALALLNRASSEWRSNGGESGLLHWPTAIAFATRELRDALKDLEPPAPAEPGESFPGCDALAREVGAAATPATSATDSRRLIPPDAAAGMAWWNGLTPTRRMYWLEVAGSAVPADAWRAFRAEGAQP